MRVLLTGANGFVGRHLHRELLGGGHEVTPIAGPHAAEGGLDIRDAGAVERAVDAARPEAVVHLCGFSSAIASHEDPAEAIAVNGLGTVHLLAAVRRRAPTARVLVVSSAEVYGPVPDGQPVDEDAPLRPESPYATGKIAGEVAALQFHRSYATDVLCARPFNHLGAGQSDRFAVPAIARHIAAIRRGDSDPVLRTGDLSTVRDFLHVGDVVAAYVHLLQRGTAGAIYNVASGEGRTMRSVVEEMLRIAGMQVPIEIDPLRVRKLGSRSLVGNAQRLRALGWAPKFELRAALRDVLNETGIPGV
jgi:GDP-4-dehydro-6-deoxy-D-mannose reductase